MDESYQKAEKTLGILQRDYTMMSHYCRLVLLEMAHLQLRQKQLIEKNAVGLLMKLEFPKNNAYFGESYHSFKGSPIINRVTNRYDEEFFASIFSFCTQCENILMYDLADILVDHIFEQVDIIAVENIS
jgi:hypothetical protein